MHWHWSARYLGLPYDAASADCADFVSLVRREQFGHRIVLPSRARTHRARDAQIVAAATAIGEPTDTPADGDLALLRAAGRRRQVGRHAGLWCVVEGAGFVLHATAGAGVCLHPAHELPRYGFELAGTFRWARAGPEFLS